MALANCYLTLYSAVLLLLICHAAAKELNLSMLVTLVETGDEPRKGIGCKAGVEIAVEAFNARKDVLPNYWINPVFQDEGGGALLLTKRVIEFVRRFDNPSTKNNNGYPSPITLGPWYSAGCGAYAQTAKFLNMVQLTFGCNAGNYIQQRVLFPNTYRSASSAYLLAYPYLKFMKEVGNWKRIAILTYADNSFDYTLALRIQDEAGKNNITVSHFDIVHDVSEHTVTSLLANDPRIIDLQIAVPPIIVRFLCLAYKFGLTGPLYTILLLYESYFTPDSLPEVIDGPSCTRKIIEEQLRYCIWTGWQPADTETPNKTTSGGYDLAYFEKRFLQLTGGVIPADYGQRLFCHDTALKGLLALDLSETTLNKQNRTLRDFTTDPQTVMRIVNQSVVASHFDGLRLKRFQYDQQTLEMDAVEVQAISRWTPEKGLQFHYRSKIVAGSDPFKLENHYFQELIPLQWFTKNAKPQNDRSVIVEIFETVDAAFLYAIIAVAILFSAGQLIVPMFSWKQPTKTECPHPIANVCLYASLLFFNLVAIIFSIPDIASALYVTCFFRPIVLALAFSLLQAFLWTAIHALFKVKVVGFASHKSQIRLSSRGLPHAGASTSAFKRSTEHSARTIASIDLETKQKMAMYLCWIPVLITVALLIAWLCMEEINIVVTSSEKTMVYREDLDIFEKSEFLQCDSKSYLPWTLTFVGVHIVCFTVEGFFIYSLSQRPWLKGLQIVKTLNMILINSVVLLVATILLVAIFKSFIVKQMTISIATLLLSLAITLSHAPVALTPQQQQQSENRN